MFYHRVIPIRIVLDRFMPSCFHALDSLFPDIAYKVLAVGDRVAMLHAVASVTLAMYVRLVPPKRYAYP